MAPSIAIIFACKFSKSPTQTSTLSPIENECAEVGSSLAAVIISRLTSINRIHNWYKYIYYINKYYNLFINNQKCIIIKDRIFISIKCIICSTEMTSKMSMTIIIERLKTFSFIFYIFTFWLLLKTFKFRQSGLYTIGQNCRHGKVLIQETFTRVSVAFEKQKVTIRMHLATNCSARKVFKFIIQFLFLQY